MRTVQTLSKDECQLYQLYVSLLAQVSGSWDLDLIGRYLDQTRTQADGTLDPILLHYMSITDLRKAQHNLRFMRAMGEHILAISKLIKDFNLANTSSETPQVRPGT